MSDDLKFSDRLRVYSAGASEVVIKCSAHRARELAQLLDHKDEIKEAARHLHAARAAREVYLRGLYRRLNLAASVVLYSAAILAAFALAGLVQ